MTASIVALVQPTRAELSDVAVLHATRPRKDQGPCLDGSCAWGGHPEPLSALDEDQPGVPESEEIPSSPLAALWIPHRLIPCPFPARPVPSSGSFGRQSRRGISTREG